MFIILPAVIFAALAVCFFSFLSTVLTSVSEEDIENLRDRNEKVDSFFKKLNTDISPVASLKNWHHAALMVMGVLLGTCFINGYKPHDFLLPIISLIFILAADVLFVRISPVSEELFVRLLPIILAFYRIMLPFQFALLWIVRIVPKRLERKMTEDDLINIVERASEDGVLEKKERDMIQNVVRLSETEASEIMIPRLDVIAVEKSSSVCDLAELSLKHGFSRFPVYEGSIDNIKGIVHMRDLIEPLRAGRDVDIQSLARPPLFIPENKKNYDIMIEMQRSKTAMAVVVDEYGGTEGIITIEDVLEEIVGDIFDEYDKDNESVKKQPDGSFLVAGKTSIEELNEVLDIELSNEEVDSIGGYVYAKTGHIPKEGESLEADGMKITVAKVIRRRITLLKIELQKK